MGYLKAYKATYALLSCVTSRASLVAVETQHIESVEDLEESVDINEAFQSSVAVGDHAFSKMEADHDRLRRDKIARTYESSSASRAGDSVEQYYERERAKTYVCLCVCLCTVGGGARL